MKMGVWIDRQEARIHTPTCLWWWWGVKQCEMKWMWGGGAERWTSVERHSKEPQVAHCSPAAAPASPPPSSSLPGNRTPLKASAWAIQREARGVGCMGVCVCIYMHRSVCMCVCVLHHKEGLLLSTYTNSARYHAKCQIPFKIYKFLISRINCSKWLTDHYDESN